MPDEKQQEWVNLTEAARLIGVNKSKLSRMAHKGQIATKTDPYDFRLKLVDLIQLREIFPPRQQKGN